MKNKAHSPDMPSEIFVNFECSYCGQLQWNAGDILHFCYRPWTKIKPKKKDEDAVAGTGIAEA